jgi:hypothetical protein
MLTAKRAGSRGPCGQICVWPILGGSLGGTVKGSFQLLFPRVLKRNNTLSIMLSHAGPMTQHNPRLPGKPKVVPSVHPPKCQGGRVGPSDLRHPISHRSKISHQFLRCARKTGDLARNCTREPREIHEKKSVKKVRGLHSYAALTQRSTTGASRR